MNWISGGQEHKVHKPENIRKEGKERKGKKKEETRKREKGGGRERQRERDRHRETETEKEGQTRTNQDDAARWLGDGWQLKHGSSMI